MHDKGIGCSNLAQKWLKISEISSRELVGIKG